DRLIIPIRVGDAIPFDLDVTECESPQHPLLDRYELLQSRHLRQLQPIDLKSEAFNAFFDRSAKSWEAYAAGVPWARSPDSGQQVLKTLENLIGEDSAQSPILVVASEAGAGGTTMARTL